MTPSKQIAALLGNYTPAMQKQARACLSKLRKLMPNAIEMVYDYGFQLVFAFGSTEDGSRAAVGLMVTPKGMSLAFNHWKSLPDPEKRLGGAGKLVRKLPLRSPADLAEPYVAAILQAAIAASKVPMDPTARHRIVIKSNAAKKLAKR